MEADRTESDIGKSIIPELEVAENKRLKKPRKRFIGRRAAAEQEEQKTGLNKTIEDSDAIQGL